MDLIAHSLKDAPTSRTEFTHDTLPDPALLPPLMPPARLLDAPVAVTPPAGT